MKLPLLSTFVLAAFLSACTAAGPDFKSPETPAVQTYTAETEILTPSQHIALGKEIADEWWMVFASPPLNDMVKQAMAGNYDIAAAKETLAQAEESVKAESGSLWPQASLGATAGRQKYGAALFGPANFSIPPFTYYEAGPEISWTLDIFGGARRDIERQQALAEYQSHQLDAADVALTGNVVAEALNLAATKAEVTTTEQIIAEDQKTLALVQESFQAGAGTRTDVLTAQSQIENDQTLLPSLRQRLSVASHALSILMGKAPAEWTPPDFTLNDFTLPQELPVSLPSEMVRKRPDILAAESNLHAASAAMGVATANLYPKITLTANLMQEALTPEALFNASNNAWALAAGVTAPVFSGGTLTAEQHEAEHAYQAALAQYQQIILNAFGQVADALTALSHDAEAVAAEQQALDTANSSLDLARKSYQAGNTGLLQIQNTQRQLAQAQLGLIRAQSQRFADTAKLFVALGGSPMTK